MSRPANPALRESEKREAELRDVVAEYGAATLEARRLRADKAGWQAQNAAAKRFDAARAALLAAALGQAQPEQGGLNDGR